MFGGLTALTTLDLRDNALAALPANVFDGLTALETLRLSDNELATLPDDVFAPLVNLAAGGLWLEDNPGFDSFVPAVAGDSPPGR